ncbi:O-antigen ligase family protein [Nocardioides jejuensis]|uniref:O-antigen ligase domain-containing protein n=1 Tax=Nocardioides jejuensis TaxID=2502782 RepID=A0A4R1CI66_9ACTN|nr:O-antigen ligase family protein [Nocardioides jejuensis]TCJ30155.1 O-antigen ligase domain-containing protein [Nocardioides jejuensis]
MTEGLRRDGLLTIAAVGLTVVLVYAAATISPVVALGAAIAIVIFVTLGMDRTGLLCMLGAFATAPMGRGIDSLSGHVSTPTDLLLIAGIFLLLPGIVHHKLGLPALWTSCVLLLVCLALVGSLITHTAFMSLFSLVQWIEFFMLLPAVIAWWRPSRQIIVALLWAYVGGHMLSTAYGLMEGAAPVTLRYDGLTIHPNAFGLAGLVTIAICFYLFHHHKEQAVRLAIVGVVFASALSIWLSGSRSALAVALVLAIMLPLVERSALSGFAVAGLGCLGLAALPLAAHASGKGSALNRLLGDGTADVADSVRETALSDGIHRFFQHPILGAGLVDVELVHNVYVEVAIATGIIGLIAYIAVLFTLGRGLFGDHPERRLAWLPWAAIGIAAALPGLWDRSIWVPASLAILPTLKEATDKVLPGQRYLTGRTPSEQPDPPTRRLMTDA